MLFSKHHRLKVVPVVESSNSCVVGFITQVTIFIYLICCSTCSQIGIVICDILVLKKVWDAFVVSECSCSAAPPVKWTRLVWPNCREGPQGIWVSQKKWNETFLSFFLLLSFGYGHDKKGGPTWSVEKYSITHCGTLRMASAYLYQDQICLIGRSYKVCNLDNNMIDLFDCNEGSRQPNKLKW